ncbi:hypothetical protein E2C01_061690 [Portunus trituberculatus]|uniref:Uncharacterized protein n=1 Tax=Portunus trituberculatus TaxID=210409 RepID=A0A5B7HBN6_PORTR|nr:hypothetical protein [Portunus trituberculatus]
MSCAVAFTILAQGCTASIPDKSVGSLVTDCPASSLSCRFAPSLRDGKITSVYALGDAHGPGGTYAYTACTRQAAGKRQGGGAAGRRNRNVHHVTKQDTLMVVCDEPARVSEGGQSEVPSPQQSTKN